MSMQPDHEAARVRPAPLEQQTQKPAATSVDGPSRLSPTAPAPGTPDIDQQALQSPTPGISASIDAPPAQPVGSQPAASNAGSALSGTQQESVASLSARALRADEATRGESDAATLPQRDPIPAAPATRKGAPDPLPASRADQPPAPEPMKASIQPLPERHTASDEQVFLAPAHPSAETLPGEYSQLIPLAQITETPAAPPAATHMRVPTAPPAEAIAATGQPQAAEQPIDPEPGRPEVLSGDPPAAHGEEQSVYDARAAVGSDGDHRAAHPQQAESAKAADAPPTPQLATGTADGGGHDEGIHPASGGNPSDRVRIAVTDAQQTLPPWVVDTSENRAAWSSAHERALEIFESLQPLRGRATLEGFGMGNVVFPEMGVQGRRVTVQRLGASADLRKHYRIPDEFTDKDLQSGIVGITETELTQPKGIIEGQFVQEPPVGAFFVSGTGKVSAIIEGRDYNPTDLPDHHMETLGILARLSQVPRQIVNEFSQVGFHYVGPRNKEGENAFGNFHAALALGPDHTVGFMRPDTETGRPLYASENNGIGGFIRALELQKKGQLERLSSGDYTIAASLDVRDPLTQVVDILEQQRQAPEHLIIGHEEDVQLTEPVPAATANGDPHQKAEVPRKRAAPHETANAEQTAMPASGGRGGHDGDDTQDSAAASGEDPHEEANDHSKRWWSLRGRSRKKGDGLITVSRTARYRLGDPEIDEDRYRRVAEEVFGLPDPPKVRAKGLFKRSPLVGLHPLKGDHISVNVVASEHEAGRERRNPRKKRYTTSRATAHELQHESDRVNHPWRTRAENAGKYAWAAGTAYAIYSLYKYIPGAESILTFALAQLPYYIIDPSERRARRTQNNDEIANQLEGIIVFPSQDAQDTPPKE